MHLFIRPFCFHRPLRALAQVRRYILLLATTVCIVIGVFARFKRPLLAVVSVCLFILAAYACCVFGASVRLSGHPCFLIEALLPSVFKRPPLAVASVGQPVLATVACVFDASIRFTRPLLAISSVRLPIFRLPPRAVSPMRPFSATMIAWCLYCLSCRAVAVPLPASRVPCILWLWI